MSATAFGKETEGLAREIRALGRPIPDTLPQRVVHGAVRQAGGTASRRWRKSQRIQIGGRFVFEL